MDDAQSGGVGGPKELRTPGHFPSDPNAPTELSQDAPKDSLLGAQLGNYHIIGLLGRGGFGAVYKARDTKLDRPVALKFLLDTLQPDHLALFEREAKAIAALSKHPAIVQIHSWGEYDGKVYMALEYIDSSADHLLRSHPQGVDVAQALRLVQTAAEGLAYAHQQGVLHRDIKPANILVDSQSGKAKLADFGLAKFTESLQGSILQGRISGSPPFMSPEQATGGLYDERSDIFSLGVTLYNLLTGALPYEGKTPSRVIEKVVKNQKVNIADRRADLPAGVVDIVNKATAFEPGDRYDSAEEFIAAIKEAQTHLGEVIAPTETKKPAPPALLVGGAIIAAAALLAVGVSFFRGSDARSTEVTAQTRAQSLAPSTIGDLAPAPSGTTNADTAQPQTSAAAPSLADPPASKTTTPENAIRYYLEAWRKADYDAMYAALAETVREGIPYSDFRDALTHDVRGVVARVEGVEPEGEAPPRDPAPNPFHNAGNGAAEADTDPFRDGIHTKAHDAIKPVPRDEAPWWFVDVAFTNGTTGAQRIRTGVLREGGGWRIGPGGLVPVGGGSSLFRRPQL